MRTEKDQNRNQFDVVYQKGKLNQTDFISHRGKLYTKLTVVEQRETNDLNNLLGAPHSFRVIYKLDLKNIVGKTKKDPVLSQISQMIQQRQPWVPKKKMHPLTYVNLSTYKGYIQRVHTH